MANLINANSNQNYFQFHESHYKYEKGTFGNAYFQVNIQEISTEFGRYRISRPIRRTFFPEKCDLNSTRVLCAEGRYYFQTYKYPYIFYMKKVAHRVKTTMKMIVVAVARILWVSMMNKLYYGC